jgi:serine dehydrogenase proteinase
MNHSQHAAASDIIEQELVSLHGNLERVMGCDVVALISPIRFDLDCVVRDVLENLKHRGKRLVVLLETGGGLIEITQRVVDVLRHHYDRVEFVIPDFAMSAGTVLAMSGDVIYMDYYSILGPIDPQMKRPDGEGYIPALGYIEQYERLIEKSQKGILTTAEMAILLQKFDMAELASYEHARELSVNLIQEWLTKYKFKDWNVADDKKKERAEEIARKLNQTERWHSHGRGISMAVLRGELELKISDFGEDSNLSSAIRKYHTLLVDYMRKRDHIGVLHSRSGYALVA